MADEQTSAPADEQPAADQEHTRDGDPGVDLGHSAGTPRAEDLDPDAESGREDTGTQGASDRPTGESTGRDATSVDPRDADK